jgi:FAD/FMN-containing dehydrogenase
MDKRFPIEDQIEMLASALRGRVVTPKDMDYDELRAVALSNFDERPAAVIRVASAADVAAVLNFVQATDLPLAIRSGGHSTIGGSGVTGGIVMDLRDLNAIDIDEIGKTAWVGAGQTAGEVSAAVTARKLIIGFGDAGTVGVGGLTLGGGIGYMIRKHGLTIDNLLAAEIVTANGDILVADANHHADLFWALRGGGGNFGVVTRFRFQLHDLPHFVGGPLVLPPTPEVLAGFAAASAAAPEELTTIGYVMPLPPAPFVPAEAHGKLAFVAMMAWSGAPEKAAAALAPFRALATPLADLVGPVPYTSLYMLDPPPEMKSSVAIRSRFAESFGLDEAAAMLEAMNACDAPMKMAQLRVLGGAFARVPAEATAFAHRDGKVLVAFLAMYGGGPDISERYEAWATNAVASLDATQPTVAYVNFLGKEGTTGLNAAYPRATLERLRRVKAKYDPENLFRLNQNILPAA